jgi:hypothetical protein
MTRFVYFSDSKLTGKMQALSLWEIQNMNDHANLNFLSSSLQEAKGGLLGVKRLAEVRIGYPYLTNLAQWSKLLAPVKPEGDLWRVGSGPALRLVSSQAIQVESIVLQVQSLEMAKAILSQRNLLGKATHDSLELDAAKIWGLRIILREQ